MSAATSAASQASASPAAGAADAEVGLALEGLRCAGCAHRVERTLRAATGVREASVDYTTHRALVRYDAGATSRDALVREVRALGFDATPYDPEALERPQERGARQALVRLLVAAFLAGNVMWLAVALYAGGYEGMEPDVRRVLRWLVVVLSVPAATWCAAPFWKGAWHGLRRGVLTIDVPIVLGVATSLGTTVAGTLAEWDHLYVDSAAVIVFLILLGRTLERRARARASAAVDRLTALTPREALRVGPEGVARVPTGSLRSGDRVRVPAGELFPTDGEITRAAVEADLSIVTGESLPVLLSPGDAVPAGARALGSEAEIVVRAPAAQGTVARMAGLLERAQASRPSLQRLADRVAGWFAPAVLAAAAAAVVTGLAQGLAPLDVAMRAAAVLIVACPCALGLATPAAVAAALGRAAELGLLVRRGDAFERLAAADVALLDKTGTLTEGAFRVASVEPAPGVVADALLRLAARAEGGATHPIAEALRRAAPGAGEPFAPAQVRPGLGVVAGLGDAAVRVGTLTLAREAGATPSSGALLRAEALAAEGHTVVWVAEGARLLGAVALADAPRADAARAVERLRAAGLSPELVTGDQEPAARLAARSAGIDTCLAAVPPEGKVARVEALRAAGRTVLAVGDGLNDAAALGAADVGVAMARGSDVTRHAADVVVRAPRLGAVADAVALARATLRRIRENLGFAVAYNAVAIPLAFTGVLDPLYAAIAMSLSSLVVTGNAVRLLRFEPGA